MWLSPYVNMDSSTTYMSSGSRPGHCRASNVYNFSESSSKTRFPSSCTRCSDCFLLAVARTAVVFPSIQDLLHQEHSKTCNIQALDLESLLDTHNFTPSQALKMWALHFLHFGTHTPRQAIFWFKICVWPSLGEKHCVVLCTFVHFNQAQRTWLPLKLHWQKYYPAIAPTGGSGTQGHRRQRIH